jgi:hypothetical protein
MIKAHTDWTMEELWRQERGNFSAHLALMFRYLLEQELSLDDFIRYTAEAVIAGWKPHVSTVADMMNGVLVNVLANGGQVLEADIADAEASATVTTLLDHCVMEDYGVAPETADRFWDKFIPLGDALGMRFTWERTDEGHYLIHLKEVN